MVDNYDDENNIISLTKELNEKSDVTVYMGFRNKDLVTLEDEYKIAADLDENDNLTATDLSTINKMVLKILWDTWDSAKLSHFFVEICLFFHI